MKSSNKENPKILNDFLDYLLKIKNFSKNTVEGYGTDLRLFFKFLKEYLTLDIPIKDFNVFILSSVKHSDIIAFFVYLGFHRDNTASTRERKKASIRAFYKWLLNNYPTINIKINPTEALPFIKKVERIPKYLTIPQAKQICNIFTLANCNYPIRNNMIVTLFLNTGLRLSELCNINIRDIDFKHKCFSVVGKGNIERKILISENIKQQLQEYINFEKITDLDRPLFISRQGNRISARAVQVICKKAFKLMGLDKKGYTTHTLRHTFATIMYKSCNKDILLLKELMGHTSIEATQIYTHIDEEEIRKAYESNPLADFDVAA